MTSQISYTNDLTDPEPATVGECGTNGSSTLSI
jgi:hypothetical protein